MLEFKKLQLSDIDKISHYFPLSVKRICDDTVGGAFMWRDFFSVEFAEYNDTIIFKARVRYHDNITAFSVPLGKDVRGSIDMVASFCLYNKMPIAFFTVTDDDLTIFQDTFDDYRLYKNTDWSDYVYRAVDMKALSGRKYHGQRNHINFFKRTYEDYSYEEITVANVGEAKAFYTALSSKLDISSELMIEDHCKTIEVLDNFETYGLLGGMLKANGSVVAFSVGEIINNVLFVHIEKADLQFRGAYQVINNEFAKHFASDGIEFINREEDVGDEGLRISKISYHPHEILDKYLFVVQ